MAREMDAAPLRALMPMTYKAASPDGPQHLEVTVAYALGLQGNVSEAKQMVLAIEQVVMTAAGSIWIGTTDDLTEEMSANLIQAFSDMYGLGAGAINITRVDSAAWKSGARATA